jgi:hypothetical protein
VINKALFLIEEREQDFKDVPDDLWLKLDVLLQEGVVLE